MKHTPAVLTYTDDHGKKHVVDVLLHIDEENGSIDTATMTSIDHRVYTKWPSIMARRD